MQIVALCYRLSGGGTRNVYYYYYCFLQAFQVVEDCGNLSLASLVAVVVGGRQISKQALSLCAFIAGMEEGSGGTGDGTLF